MSITTQLQQLLRTLLPDKGFKTAGHHRDAIIAGVEEAKTYTDEKSAEAVKKTGNETIAGVKTFSDGIIGNVTGNASTVTNGVYTLGDQTIGGVKAFTSSPVVPDATLPQHPVTLEKGVLKTDIESARSQSITKIPSSKLIDDELDVVISKTNAEYIQYFSSARLTWNSLTKTLSIVGDADPTAPTLVFRLNYKSKTIYLLNTIKSRTINNSGNYQLLFPIPDSSTVNYTLDGIIIQEGTSYNKDAYIKIGHLIFANGMSSLIIQDTTNSVDIYDLDYNSRKLNIDIHSSIDGYNFSNDLVIGRYIAADGKIAPENNFERGYFFFRLFKTGIAAQINGCTPLVFQWYSSNPDFLNGSNSLGRTTTNTPPANAKYCGLTVLLSGGYTNITISENTTSLSQLLVKSSAINNSAGESAFASGISQRIKILAFGNSYMRNSAHYLSSISSGLGVGTTIGNLYTGGTQLSNHLGGLTNGGSDYEWHKYIDGVPTDNLYNQSSIYGLLDERWDVILIHQYTPWTQPFEPYLNLFISKIIDIIGYCPKFYIVATWAIHKDYVYSRYGFNSEEEMWQTIVDLNQKASQDSGILNIIPVGTAIQNARTLTFADSFNRFVNSGTDWSHLNPAGGFIAACTIYEKIIKPLNNVSCINTSFRITTDTYLPPQETVEVGVTVTDTNYISLCSAAISAINNPLIISQIS